MQQSEREATSRRIRVKSSTCNTVVEKRTLELGNTCGVPYSMKGCTMHTQDGRYEKTQRVEQFHCNDTFLNLPRRAVFEMYETGRQKLDGAQRTKKLSQGYRQER